MNEIATIEPTSLALAFQRPGGIEDLISRVEAEARSHAMDVTTAKGRDAIKSLAFKVARTKTAMDEAGKALNESARAQINAVDAERRKLRDRLDALRAEVRAPLDQWEAAEAARVDAIKARLERLRLAHDMLPPGAGSEQIASILARVEIVAIDATWAEFADEAARYRGQAIATLRHMQGEAVAREAAAAEAARQAEELAVLRAEKAAREEADRIAREAAADAERKRVAAEQAEQARIVAERAEAERQARQEQEKQEAAQRAAQEAERRAQEREVALRAQIEVERAKEAQARREAEIRHAREIAEAQAERDRAAQAERDRIAAQAKAEADARAKREADQAHRAKIHTDIVDALRSFSGRATPEAIANAIMDGRIPHVRVMI